MVRGKATTTAQLVRDPAGQSDYLYPGLPADRFILYAPGVPYRISILCADVIIRFNPLMQKNLRRKTWQPLRTRPHPTVTFQAPLSKAP